MNVESSGSLARNPVIYADFNTPLCYLAGLWADRWKAAGIQVDWRAVEHAPHLSRLGLPSAAAAKAPRSVPGSLAGELIEAVKLPLPDEEDGLPTDLPPFISNTRAAVAAFAEAVADGVQDEIRRGLLSAIWIERRHLSSAYDVRRVVTEVTYPRVPIGPYRSSSLPQPMTGDPDPLRTTRRQGGTITPDGSPLTTLGYQRVGAWREQWQSLGQPPLPVLIDDRGTIYAGIDAVLRLAGRTAWPIVPVQSRANEREPISQSLTASFH